MSMRADALLCTPFIANTPNPNPTNGCANTPELMRTYSSVYEDQAPGTGYARSAIDGPQAWSVKPAGLELDDEWMQLDLGETKLVAGTVIQPRADYPQHVTSYTVSYSLDGTNWTDVDGTFQGTETGTTENTFSAPLSARYLKLWPKTGVGRLSMRADALVCPPPKRSYSSCYDSMEPGSKYTLSAIDTLSACWSVAVGQDDVNQWLQLDLEYPRLVAGTVIQKHSYKEEWVTSYTVSYSLTGEDGDWTDVDGTYEGVREGLSEGLFPVAVLARYVKIHPKTWQDWIAMRADALVVAGYVPILAMTRNISAILHKSRERCMQ